MFPSGHDKPHFCMQSHSDPQVTVHLSLGISGQGTSVHVPSAAHTRAVLEGSHISSLPYTHTYLQNKQDFLSPVYSADYKKALCTAQGCSLCSTGWRCLKKPSLCPASCNALVRDEQATLPAWPSPSLHPLCRKGCWSNVLLPVKITYVAKRQEMSQPRR